MLRAIVEIEGISLKGRITIRGLTLTYRPWAHAKGCRCTVEQTFTCGYCGRRMGWCMGAADNMVGACDFCWRPPKDESDETETATDQPREE